MEEILNKISHFTVEVAKAGLYSDLYKQQEHLEMVCIEIEKYLINELVNSDENRTIEITTASLHRIQRTYLKREFIKDEKKRMKILVQNIKEAEGYLNTELKVLKDYVLKGDIVLK